MNRQEKIAQLQSLQNSLENCTMPITGHTDPKSINDCWKWMRELLAEIKDEDEKLLLRAENLEVEQVYKCKDDYAESVGYVLLGIQRINNLIRRHLGYPERQTQGPSQNPLVRD